MLKPEELRKGNLIQYDHDERRQPPVCMQRGWVKEIHTDYVVLTNGEKRKWERTEGLPIDEGLLVKFGFMDLDGEHCPLFGKEDLEVEIVPPFNSYKLRKSIGGFSLYISDIEHLHQLQNLHYYLKEGQELEITVPEPR